MIGDDHDESDFSIIPKSSIRCISLSTLLSLDMGIGYGRWYIGSPGFNLI